MAFGYRYWMVYLPQFNRESFLLFVHNPAEQTKLRDYSGESVKVLGQPTAKATLGATDLGRTRFEVDPHDTTDFYYWHRATCDHNFRYLRSSRSVLASVTADRNQVACRPSSRNGIEGRALRGSRRQLQDYVNEHETELTRAIIEKLPPRLQELGRD